MIKLSSFGNVVHMYSGHAYELSFGGWSIKLRLRIALHMGIRKGHWQRQMVYVSLIFLKVFRRRYKSNSTTNGHLKLRRLHSVFRKCRKVVPELLHCRKIL